MSLDQYFHLLIFFRLRLPGGNDLVFISNPEDSRYMYI